MTGVIDVDEGVFMSSSAPGGVGCGRYRMMKMIMIAMAAINPARNLFLVMFSRTILSLFYNGPNGMHLDGSFIATGSAATLIMRALVDRIQTSFVIETNWHP
jgi:hypothetical protein